MIHVRAVKRAISVGMVPVTWLSETKNAWASFEILPSSDGIVEEREFPVKYTPMVILVNCPISLGMGPLRLFVPSGSFVVSNASIPISVGIEPVRWFCSKYMV